MRSERLVPVSEILPRISAMLIGSNYTTTLSAEQLSELLGHVSCKIVCLLPASLIIKYGIILTNKSLGQDGYNHLTK